MSSLTLSGSSRSPLGVALDFCQDITPNTRSVQFIHIHAQSSQSPNLAMCCRCRQSTPVGTLQEPDRRLRTWRAVAVSGGQGTKPGASAGRRSDPPRAALESFCDALYRTVPRANCRPMVAARAATNLLSRSVSGEEGPSPSFFAGSQELYYCTLASC